MTLAKTCYASNMIQDLEKATYRPVAICNHESFLNRDVSAFHMKENSSCKWREITQIHFALTLLHSTLHSLTPI